MHSGRRCKGLEKPRRSPHLHRLYTPGANLACDFLPGVILPQHFLGHDIVAVERGDGLHDLPRPEPSRIGPDNRKENEGNEQTRHHCNEWNGCGTQGKKGGATGLEVGVWTAELDDLEITSIAER